MNTPTNTPMNAPTTAPLHTIPISQLRPFPGQPYKVLDDADMDELTESIRSHGILTPLIVRPLDHGTYEIISGHRRFRAAMKAGLAEVPAFIYPLDRDAAAIALVDSNLHRARILPSEKAFAYKLKMDALRHQGKRSDFSCPVTSPVTSAQLEPKLSAEAVSEEDSAAQVKRYIRLTNLIPGILDMVDAGQIAFTPAVELSYLTRREQADLLETMRSEDRTPSLSQAQQMKKLSQAGELSMDRILELMTQIKGNQKETVKLPEGAWKPYTDRLGLRTPREREEFIVKALDYYTRHLLRQRSRDSR